MKIAANIMVRIFLLFESSDTSSRGPGCLNMDMNRTKMAMGRLT